MNWINAGLSGDCLENVHWRIKDYVDSANIVKVFLAAGNNNLFKHSVDEIVQEIRDIHNTLLEKFPNTSIRIQSILPRLLVAQNIDGKIREINDKLFENFGHFFLNTHKEFMTEKGVTKKDLLRRDGLHLSQNRTTN